MSCYIVSCTSAELEFGVADIQNNKRSMGRESEVQPSTSAKQGFQFRGHPKASVSDGNPA